MNIEDEYIQLDIDLDKIEAEMFSDKTIATIDDQIKSLTDTRALITEGYEEQRTPLVNRLNEIEKIFISMYDGKKTLPLSRVTLNYRETKSLKVLNPGAIVDTLVKINQVDKGVKSFALKHLRSLAEADVLPGDSYQWDVKLNLSVKEKDVI